MNSTSHCRFLTFSAGLFSALLFLPSLSAAETPPAPDSTTKPAPSKAASEDKCIPNFHSLGEIANRSNIFRCGNPVGSIADQMKGNEPTDAERQLAKGQMQHLYDLGVRTVVSLQRQEPLIGTKPNPEYRAVVLEKLAAQDVGMTYVAYSMGNSGKDTLQYMSDDAVFKLVESIGNDIVKHSEAGGVAFHCKSGKDRTGLVAAYLRIKYQHWSVDQALIEMRQRGHVWKKFLKPGNSFSWHEEHLRAMGQMLAVQK